ncbi:MAG TPA: MlaE family lipid ABC transporter permease subunit [Candidatus Cloacimonadota bacterium]|nr:MlaE family lipid ABC transporter permease subunit [Candidatus Cloacimonadota bacterium]HPT73075.1 MlaE family lipid ABC transporter permease subunit [Candidatus Cloacimonadota bacterium]
MEILNNRLFLKGKLDFYTTPDLFDDWNKLDGKEKVTVIDLSGVESIDSAGVAFIDEIYQELIISDRNIYFSDIPERIRESLHTFSSKSLSKEEPAPTAGFFEHLGELAYNAKDYIYELLFLSSEIFYWSFIGLFNRKQQRKGSFIQQSIQIGVDALGIVTLLSLIIGLIISLQSAAQLRLFGANIFIADLLSVSMVREMGPMMTAIIVAGRSGSAIAAEIATMQVTEEIDALKIMGLNPLRYIVVPKFHAFTLCMPILVTFAIFIGMFGGFVIAVTYLDLNIVTFISRSINILTIKDVIVSLSKSTFFSWLIVIIGSFYGFRVKGGAEGVGKATTDSVVASIFAVIVFDAIFSLLYLGD